MSQVTTLRDGAQQLDDAAWAAMARTADEAAEVERANRMLSERQSFEIGLENWLEERAAEEARGREEEEAEQVAAAAATARRKAGYRSKRDGLTQDERALLRLPDRYDVEEVAPGHWWATHRDCEAIFSATRVDGRTLRIVSNTGAEYTCRVEDDYTVTCPCEHAKRMREWGHVGLCKHGAVAVAVADFNRALKAA